MFERVLLCYDGSSAARRALRRGAELAIQLKSRVFILAIIPEGVADPAAHAGGIGHACLVDPRQGYRQMLEESLRWLRERGVEAEGYLACGSVTDQIVAHARRLSIDLIVLGYYPKPAGGYWWAGPQRKLSLAERANCCVLVAVEPQAGARPSVAGAGADVPVDPGPVSDSRR